MTPNVTRKVVVRLTKPLHANLKSAAADAAIGHGDVLRLALTEYLAQVGDA